jgi:hypothetical protein
LLFISSEVVAMKNGLRAVVAVWATAFLAAAGLAYSLGGPADVAPNATHLHAVKFAALVTYVGEPHVIAKLGAAPTLVASAPLHARDISEMRCTGWRPLEQGGERVQYCD